MKKIIVSVVVLAMLLTLVACGAAAPQESGQIANPVHEVTAQELSEVTGLELIAPQGAENVVYSYIDQPEGLPVAQLSFTLDGTACCYRAVSADIPGDTLRDISGLYYDWSSEDSGDVANNSGELHWVEGEQGWIGWYDYAPGVLYCLSVDRGADKELLISLANEVFAPSQAEADAENESAGGMVQPQCVKDSGSLTADLDGDGAAETVTILERTADEFGNKEYYFGVAGGNGASAEGNGEDGIYVWSKPVLWLADIDGDSLPEILFSGDSGSDDYYTVCYKWKADALSPIQFESDYDGFCDGCVEAVENGVITIGAYCYVMGTYGGERPYAMNDSGIISPVPQSVWSFAGNEMWLTTSAELPVSVSGQPQTLAAGTELLLSAFDGVGTVYYTLRDNTEGTIAVSRNEDSYGWMIDGRQEADCFEFLPYAG